MTAIHFSLLMSPAESITDQTLLSEGVAMMLTVKKAAMTAGVSPSLVYAWCNEGRLPHRRLGRRGKRGAIRIQPEDLEALLEECKGETGRPQPSPFVLNHIVLN